MVEHSPKILASKIKSHYHHHHHHRFDDERPTLTDIAFEDEWVLSIKD